MAFGQRNSPTILLVIRDVPISPQFREKCCKSVYRVSQLFDWIRCHQHSLGLWKHPYHIDSVRIVIFDDQLDMSLLNLELSWASDVIPAE